MNVEDDGETRIKLISSLGAQQLSGAAIFRDRGILGKNQDGVMVGLEVSCPSMIMSVLRCPLNMEVKTVSVPMKT